MSKPIKADICIIGGGSAGLSVAAGAAQLGAKVVLLERAKMGGDCLNYGCVPSKALLAAGKAAKAARKAGGFGIALPEPQVDYAAVQAHVQRVIDTIAPHDSVERFEGLGVQVIQEAGRFVSRDTVQAGAQTIKAKRFVVATGSSAFVPPIAGIESVDYLTNETIFGLKQRPDHLIVLGGGPIGCEMAQAHAMLGIKVTLVEMFSIMPKDDPEAVAVVRAALQNDGVNLFEQAKASAVEALPNGGLALSIEQNGQTQRIEGSHLLVATGRVPNLDGLALEQAGIDHDRRGIKVGANLRSSNPRVFALGDVAGGPQFTHVAGYHASIFVRQVLFKQPAKVDYKALPWVSYTSPELGQVGLTEAMAKEQGLAVSSVKWSFAEMDRAVAEHETQGFAKILVNKKGRVVGATIVGKGAGELLQPWALAIATKMKLSTMAGHIAPYPTLSEINKRVAGAYYTPKLFSNGTRRLVGFLLRF